MTHRHIRKSRTRRNVLLAGTGLAFSLSIALGAAYRGKTTGGNFGVVKQPDNGLWIIMLRTGLGFDRYEAIYARDLADGGEDTVQYYKKSYIINFASGDRSKLYIFGDSGEPPARLGRIASRLDPAPVESAPIALEELSTRPPVVEKNWRSYQERLEAGWPMRCLSAQVVGPKIDNTYVLESVYRGAARRPNLVKGTPDTLVLFGRLKGAIPYRPMPLGLVADTLFWALVLWAVIFARGDVRRWWRIRHGQCLSCGYDRSGAVSPICPECGKAACASDDSGCRDQDAISAG